MFTGEFTVAPLLGLLITTVANAGVATIHIREKRKLQIFMGTPWVESAATSISKFRQMLAVQYMILSLHHCGARQNYRQNWI
jgi:hypothetical protein